MINWLTIQKCLITQGAAGVNMVLIFFMGGISIQQWIEKHYNYSINVAIPVVGAVFTAWFVGWLMLKTGMLKAEQTFYSRHNEVLNPREKRNGQTS